MAIHHTKNDAKPLHPFNKRNPYICAASEFDTAHKVQIQAATMFAFALVAASAALLWVNVSMLTA